jgi:hypothetical protein
MLGSLADSILARFPHSKFIPQNGSGFREARLSRAPEDEKLLDKVDPLESLLQVSMPSGKQRAPHLQKSSHYGRCVH